MRCMPAAESRKSSEYVDEVVKYVKKTYLLVKSELEELKSKVEELAMKIEELSEKIEKIEKTIAKTSKVRTAVGRAQLEAEMREILELIRKNLFVETKSIVNKKALRMLIESGKVVVLRDEMLNLEIVTTPSIVRKILLRLPKSVDEVVKEFTDREYELLKILNRLGYVLISDNKYVVSDLAKEFLQREDSSER